MGDFVLIVGPLVGFVLCFLASQVLALWSKGREKRAYFVAKLLAGSFFAATFLLFILGFQSTSPDRDGGAGMAAMALAVFLLLAGVGVGLNVLVCGLLARSAARAQAVAEKSCISRSAG